MDDKESKQQGPMLEMRDEVKKPLLSDKAKKEIREWVVSLAVAVVAVIIIRTFLFTVIRVEGPSMESTLFTGDRLIVTIIDVKLRGLERFDVVVCHYPNKSDRYVKRVIGLPGETLEVRGGVTYINGDPYDELFLDPAMTSRYHSSNYYFGPVNIPEGNYFVMGDHRDDSNDSRMVGHIESNLIIGKARLIMWPFNHAGIIENAPFTSLAAENEG
jgi:signal peptidase I